MKIKKLLTLNAEVLKGLNAVDTRGVRGGSSVGNSTVQTNFSGKACSPVSN